MNEDFRAFPLTSAAQSRAVDLIADFQARHEELRRQTEDLARRRQEVRSAAQRESAEVVAAAREEVARILDDAKSRLLVLSERLEALNAPETDVVSHGDDGLGASPSVLKAQEDLQRLFETVGPSLNDLAKHTELFTQTNHGVAPQPAPPAIDQSGTTLTAPAPVFSSYRADEGSTPRPRPTPWVIAGLTGLILAGGAAGWWLLGFSADPSGRISASKSAARPAPDALPTLTATVIPASSTGTGVPVDGTSLATQAMGTAPSPLWLAIAAHRPAWIKFSIDDQAAESRLLKPGETRSLMATRDIGIVIGDAGAVAVSVNGNQARVLGRDGQTLSRHFNLQNATDSSDGRP